MDTLRHEAHHVVQDCFSGRLGDLNSKRIFELSVLIKLLSNSTLDIERIEKNYSAMGLDDDRMLMEVEAFLVARYATAEKMASTINRVCESK